MSLKTKKGKTGTDRNPKKKGLNVKETDNPKGGPKQGTKWKQRQ